MIKTNTMWRKRHRNHKPKWSHNEM